MGPLEDTEYRSLTALDIVAALKGGALSAVEVIDAALARLGRVDPQLRAFTQVWPDRARARAHQLDQQRAHGHTAPRSRSTGSTLWP